MSSVDQTGKAAGKRILTDDGTWISVKSLPADVQAEMLANTKAADGDRMKKALSNNKEYMDLQAQKTETGLRAENAELKDIVKQQGEMLAMINAKMELGASPVKEVKAPVKEVKAKKPTKKQAIQMDCESKGIEFDEEDTISQLEEKLSAYEIDSFDVKEA